MKDKKWWKFLMPVIVVAQVVIILIFVSSATPEIDKTGRESKTEFTSVIIPDEILFADEEMPLEQFDVREAIDRELLSNAYFHSQTIRYIKLAPRYFPVIEPILKEMGIPDNAVILEMGLGSLFEQQWRTKYKL